MAAKQDDRSKYEHLLSPEEKEQSIPDTVRATDEFPAGQECELTVEDLPDSEDEFGWTNHYEHESRNRTNPDVTPEVIETLLTEGVCRLSPRSEWDDRYTVQMERNGYEWTLVVADDGEESEDQWVIITVYSNYHGSVGMTNKYLDRRKQRRGAE